MFDGLFETYFALEMETVKITRNYKKHFSKNQIMIKV